MAEGNWTWYLVGKAYLRNPEEGLSRATSREAGQEGVGLGQSVRRGRVEWPGGWVWPGSLPKPWDQAPFLVMLWVHRNWLGLKVPRLRSKVRAIYQSGERHALGYSLDVGGAGQGSRWGGTVPRGSCNPPSPSLHPFPFHSYPPLPSPPLPPLSSPSLFSFVFTLRVWDKAEMNIRYNWEGTRQPLLALAIVVVELSAPLEKPHDTPDVEQLG